MQKMRWVMAGLVCLIGWMGCGGDEGQRERGSETSAELARRTLKVVTTVGMITDVVEQIGGERVSVEGLMGPGVDPHLYKASAGDMNKMQAADVILYNGLHLEGAMAELFERMGSRTRTEAVAGRTIANTAPSTTRSAPNIQSHPTAMLGPRIR